MQSLYKLITFLLLSTFTLSNTFARLAADQWKTHMSYLNGEKLAISDNKVYCLAYGSLFSYGLVDDAIETYTKVSGLSDVLINDIAFCKTTQTLVICYDNGNIDLMTEDGIINIPDINLKPIYGSKALNKINIYNGFAYISTDFGVVKLNLSIAEISETYTLTNSDSNPINAVAIYKDKIYAASDLGLYQADLNSLNLQNFASWEKVSTLPDNNLPIIDVTTFNNNLVLIQYDANATSATRYATYKFDNSQWQRIVRFGSFAHFGSSDQYLTISCNVELLKINRNFALEEIIRTYNFASLEYPSQNAARPRHAIYKDNSIFIADSKQGLIIYTPGKETIAIKPNGIASNKVWDIDIQHNIVRIVHGGTSRYYNNTWEEGAISTLRDKSWNIISSAYNGPAYKEYVGIATDPLDPEHFFISSFGYGVLEFQDDELINAFDYDNSTLVSAIPGNKKYIRTHGITYDEDNNIWVSTGGGDPQLQLYSREQEWTAFTSNKTGSDIRYTQIAIVDNTKWIATPFKGVGILIYDDNGTYDNDSDDKDKNFSIYARKGFGDSEKVSDKVFAIEKDNNGVIWVGSDNGIAYYSNPKSVFNSGTPIASRVLIPRNDGSGNGDYLLDGESVYDIAIDGGNRKWIATASSGVYLVSPDGETLIHHFTSKNSPLLSNNVRTVEVNHETGEVFFGTEAGLISYQADATGGNNDFSDLKVYPNPVREDFFGNITIAGLVDETTVKITDVSGNLVYETKSNGGTATWDSRNFYGKRVGTGVYLIFCSNKEGTKSAMTKIMVVN